MAFKSTKKQYDSQSKSCSCQVDRGITYKCSSCIDKEIDMIITTESKRKVETKKGIRNVK